MRIAFIINSLEAGGAEKVLSDLANYWSESHNVHIITFRTEADKPFYQLKQRITLHQIGYNQRLGVLQKGMAVLPSALKLRQEIKQIQPDITLSFLDLMNVFALIALKGLSIPHIINERTNPWHHHIPLLFKWMRKFIYPWATRLVVQSPHIANYFSKKTSVIVIPNKVNQFVAPENRRSTKIISVGRLIPSKGYDVLLKAFQSLKDKYPEWSVEIYGTGPCHDALSDSIKENDLGDKVHLKGVTRTIPTVLAKASVFVFPSRYEGFPNALAEAMAAGLACVASDIPGNRDLVESGQNGLLFQSEDVQALSSQLDLILSNQDLRQSLGQEATKISEKYSEDKIYTQWDQLLKDIQKTTYRKNT